MTRNLNSLDRSFPLKTRYCLEDAALDASVKKYGILIPVLILEDDGRQILISGHKRLAAAEKAGLQEIPVQVLEKKLSAKERLLAAALSNWGQTRSELDILETSVKALRDFNFTEQEYTEELLPALGLEPQRNLIREILKMQAVEKDVLDAVAADRIPYKGAAQLLKFPPEDQRAFVQTAAVRLKLSASQLQQTVECLYDVMRQTYRSLTEILAEPDFRTVLDDEKLDLRQRTDAFMKVLRERKNPRLARMEKDFSEQAGKLAARVDGLTLEAPPFFENQGYFLKMHIRNSESLKQLQELLLQNRSSFNALLQCVL